jgi:diaminopimelate decarboxylase
MAKLAVEEGLYIDVATGGEFDLVMRAGVTPERVIVHGNNKSETELRNAIAHGVHRIVIDNFDEIDRIAAVMSETDAVDVLVRVTPGVEAHTHEFVQTGHEDTKFGFSIASGEARQAIERLQQMKGVHVKGVHAHIGSQIFDFEGFEAEIKVLAAFVRDDAFEELCIGGGLGVAYVEGESAPSITEWGQAVRLFAQNHGLEGVRLIAEPGRAIVAQAGCTIYKVGAIKQTVARRYMAVDGGMSDNPRPVLYGSGYEAFDIDHPLADRPVAYRIVGKHCESGDVLVDEAWLPSVTGIDSYIATPVTGAYGYSMASNYNRVPRPAVVFVNAGEAREVLRRETFDDLARLEV